MNEISGTLTIDKKLPILIRFKFVRNATKNKDRVKLVSPKCFNLQIHVVNKWTDTPSHKHTHTHTHTHTIYLARTHTCAQAEEDKKCYKQLGQMFLRVSIIDN